MTRIEEFSLEVDTALAELQNTLCFLKKEERRFALGSPQRRAIDCLLAHYAELLPQRDMCVAYLKTLNETPGAEPGGKGRLLQWKNADLKAAHIEPYFPPAA